MCKFIRGSRLWALSVLLVFCVCACSASTGSAAAKDPLAMGKLFTVFEAMQKANIKNLHLGIIGRLDTDVVDGSLDTEADIYVKDSDNFAAKGLLKSALGSGKDAQTWEYPFYITADKKLFSVYYQDGGQWFKSIEAIGEEKNDKKDNKTGKDNDKSTKDDADTLDISLDPETLLKGVEFGTSAPGTESYVVTLDSKSIAAAMQNATKKAPVGKEQVDLVPNDAMTALSSMKDLAIVITVDNRSNLVQEISTDLSEPLVIAATAVVNSIDSLEPAAKESILPLVQTAKLKFTVKGNKYNQIAPITVPADIVKNAKVAPKEEKSDTKKTSVNEDE